MRPAVRPVRLFDYWNDSLSYHTDYKGCEDHNQYHKKSLLIKEIEPLVLEEVKKDHSSSENRIGEQVSTEMGILMILSISLYTFSSRINANTYGHERFVA